MTLALQEFVKATIAPYKYPRATAYRDALPRTQTGDLQRFRAAGGMMRDPVAAVPEAEATGQTAAIFADIRAVYGVGVVNLVWRHLATLPDALPWVWDCVRPAYVSGAVASAAASYRAAAALPVAPRLALADKLAAGLDASAQAGIGAVLAGYDRTNAMALVALSAVMARLQGEPAGARAPAGSPAPVDAVPLPPLPALEDMAPAIAELIHRLNRLGTAEPAPLLASMYRHLSYWPGYLALAWDQLAPLDADGRLASAIAAAGALGRQQAASLLGWMPETPPPQDAMVLHAAIAQFVQGPIDRMVVNCAVLRRAWQG
jgi:hypothetical protein